MRRRCALTTDALLTALALGGVVLLTILAHAMEPPQVSLLEATQREGQRVAVEARILDLRSGDRARWVELSDGAHRLEAFAPLAPALDRGDVVRAEGVVARGERSFVLSIDALAVVAPAERIVRTPAELATEPAAYDGARVVVAGEARAGMLVGDAARVGLRGENVPREGAVVVTGTFAYREADASYVVWVESWTPRS